MKDLLGLNIKDIPAKIETDVQELEEILLKYNSFDMIGNFIVLEVFHNVDSPATYAGKSFVVEYLSLLYLKHPFSPGEGRLIDKKITEEIRSRIYNIFSSFNLLLLGEGNGNSLTERDVGNLRFKQVLEELFVRGPAYPHHAKEFYPKLYEPVNDWFIENLGFTIDTILNVSDAASTLMNEKTDVFRAKVHDTLFRFWGDVKKIRSKKTLSGEFPEEAISYFAKLPGKRAYKAARNYVYATAFAKIGTDVLSLTAEEIASKTGEQCDVISSCLDFFSLEFKEVPSTFSIPEPVHLLKSRPVIHHNKRFMFPNPALLFWAAHRRLEDSITPGLGTCIPSSGRIWKRYEKNRRNQVEKESIKLISEALDTEEYYENVFYQFAIEGNEKRCELDGMILFDNRLFLIEAKAGTLSSAARRGGEKRISRDVKKLIADAHQQVMRAKKYVESFENGDIPFSLSDGSSIAISKDRIEEIFMVTVTLENLDVYTAMLHETVQAGGFVEGELPWAVSLFDLNVITDLTDFPTQFVHYLRRRLLLNTKPNIHTHDELDWFGLYLQHGLYFDGRSDIEEYDRTFYDMFSSIFDDWYYFEMGVREKKTKRPCLPLSDHMNQLLRELSKGKEYKHSEVISLVLDMSGSARDQLEKMILSASNKTMRDGRNHDFFLTSKDGDFGISFYSFPYLGEDEKQLADNHITLRKYATKAKKWLGILHCPRHRGIVHGWLFLDEAWVFDEKLEDLKSTLKYAELPIH